MLSRILHRREFMVARVCVAAILAGATQGCPSASGTALERQLTGVAYITRLATLSHALQTHRSLSTAFVAGDTNVEFGSNEQHISEDLTSIDRFDALHGELQGVHDGWLPLKAQVRDLLENWRERPRECFQRHTDLIAAIATFAANVGEVSTLRADAAPDIQSLTEAVTAVLPEMTEAMGQTFDLVSRIAAEGGMVREQERDLFARHVTAIRSQLDRMKVNYEKAYAQDGHLRTQLDPQRQVAGQLTTGLLDLLDKEVVHAQFVTMTPDAWAPRAGAALESAQTLQDLSLSALQSQLEDRKRKS